MRPATRPQYHRLQRILQMIREGTRTGSLPNCRHFIRELEVSRRTLMRDLDCLRDDHHAPITYDVGYQRFDGATRDYLLEPYHLVAYHGNWYLTDQHLAGATFDTPPWAKTSGKAACQSKALGCTAGSLMTLLPWRMLWSRLVKRLPRAAVLIHRLSWQISEGFP